MKKTIKFLLIVLTIIAFSSGIVNLSAMFISHNPINQFFTGVISLIISHLINQEIIDSEDARINEIF